MFYPSFCMICRKPLVESEQHFCLHCLCDLPKTNYHINKGNPTRALFAGYQQINEVSSYLFFEKEGITQRLVHSLKYYGNKSLAEYLGRIAANELKNDGFYASVDTIVPVPLHPVKKRQRGYNQSEFIARGIASVYNCRIDNTSIRRNIYTKSQTRKTTYERHINVENIFEVTDYEALAGHHILLVDDVITTGATTSACIDALIAAAPEIQISVFSLSITREF